MQLQITHVGRVAPAQAPSLQPRALQPRQAVARRQRAAVTVQANFLANLFNEGKVKTAVAAAGEYDAAATRALIDKYIAENPVMVFSWSRCPFCIRGKEVLKSTGARFTALEIDQMPEGKAIRAELAKMTGRSSVPNIWIAGESVGGCNDGPGVVTLQDKGELVPMLKAAGAL